jgi:type II secretory pathway component PulF
MLQAGLLVGAPCPPGRFRAMPNFTYKAKDKSGKVVEGQMSADAKGAVVSRLQAMGLFPMFVSDAKGGDQGELEAEGGLDALALKLFGTRISIEERAQFNRQLSDLLGAGIPLARSLGIVTEQTTNKRFRRIIQRVNKDVQGGERLYRAMGRHKTVFRPIEISMIHAGEEGGLLEDVLNRLADFTEREKELRDKVVAALTYPAIMVGAGGLVVGVLVTFVFPRIVNVYKNMNQELPGITVALIKTSDFIRSSWQFILVVGFFAILAFMNFIKSREGRKAWHGLLLKIPRVGTLIVQREIAAFARTLGSLLQNGVAILPSLAITEDVVTNEVIREKLRELPERVTKGEGVSGPLKRIDVFPGPVVSMIAVGEETGNLDKTLLRVANTYERKVETEVRKLTSLIEPAIMICIAAVVAVIVIAMLLPLVGMDPSGGL